MDLVKIYFDDICEIPIQASVAHRKNRTSTSYEQGGVVRNKLKPDGVSWSLVDYVISFLFNLSLLETYNLTCPETLAVENLFFLQVASGKRTKRRTLHDEQGKKSSANDQIEASIPVDVGGYRVKAANAPILTSILAKYGDIAAHCMFTSAAVRASMLEVICDIVKRLQSNNAEDNISQLEAMESEVRDAEAAKIEVSWLQQCMVKFREAKVGKSPLLLKEMKGNLMLVSKAAQRDLAAAQKWAKEAESCMGALAVVGKKISDDMSLHVAKESEWRNPLDELAKP